MKNKYLIVLIFLAAAVFSLSIFLFVRSARRLNRTGVLNYPHILSPNNPVGAPRKFPPLSDIGAIRIWMTFDYLNKSFNLPPDYLKSELVIFDLRYPNLTLSRAAKEKQQPPALYLVTVKTAVEKLLSRNKNEP